MFRSKEVPPHHQPVANEEMVTYQSGAIRSKLEARYDLLPLAGLTAMAEAMARGLEKYPRDNWRKGIPVEQCINHAIRHLYLWLEGDRSEDHLAHCGCNVLMAITLKEEGNE
jgi:hypothetical protein